MATERLPMLQLREILRQKLALGRSHREVASALGISASSVSGVVVMARAHGLDMGQVEALSDDELQERLYPRPTKASARTEPDCAALHVELRRPGVTLALLHVEYLAAHPDGLRYTAFCERYRAWAKRRLPVMRQVHVGGDKLFVDYAGMRPRLVHPTTGEVTEVELFVAVLGASNYTFAEATRTQQVPDFVASVARALTFFGGAPRAIVPDQLKSAVTKACRYDPGVQRTTAELGRHYDTTILPARPKSPRDKAKVEAGVLVAERWLLARIRNETFASLPALNARLAELLADLNERKMRTYDTSRRALFERLDKPHLAPLPAEPFEASEWKQVRLGVDYHVDFEGHFYSAPHALRHDKPELWLRATAATVEIFHGSTRVAAHLRSHVRGGHTTRPEHMPSSHRAHAEWTTARILCWAEQVGPSTRALCEAILRDRRHPEWGYRSCLGLFRLAKKYGAPRMDAACARALHAGARSYRSVLTILQHNLDSQPLPAPETPAGPGLMHENVRGPGYFH
ncbi:MAG: IS21 family transposase [Deltaproteobacteria bacterium]|nr:IS21 family transposase [Deltaproteobacteria bacterium]